jgi:hypothetical protein
MAILFLLLNIYFKCIGGYRQVHIEGTGPQASEVGDKEAVVT